MEKLADLLQTYQLPQGAHISERAELVRYFFENAKKHWKGDKPLRVQYVGYRLAHLRKHDLYAFKSILEDKVNRGANWGKAFWGMLKT